MDGRRSVAGLRVGTREGKRTGSKINVRQPNVNREAIKLNFNSKGYRVRDIGEKSNAKGEEGIELAEGGEGRGYRFVIESRSTWMEDTEGRSQSPVCSLFNGGWSSPLSRSVPRFVSIVRRIDTRHRPCPSIIRYGQWPPIYIYTAFMICYPVFDVCCYDQRTSGLSSFSSFLFFNFPFTLIWAIMLVFLTRRG